MLKQALTVVVAVVLTAYPLVVYFGLKLGSGIQVHGLPSPNRGGPIAMAALNLATHAKLADLGHYTKSKRSCIFLAPF